MHQTKKEGGVYGTDIKVCGLKLVCTGETSHCGQLIIDNVLRQT